VIKEIVALLVRLAKSFVELGAEDLELAKLELAAKGRLLVVAIALGIFAAFVGVGALATLTACLVLALALVVPSWAAALIVTALYLVIVAIAAISAKSRLTRALPLYPRDALETLKENLEWARALMASRQI
jgi:uncharacterized membrane protein YqjE